MDCHGNAHLWTLDTFPTDLLVPLQPPELRGKGGAGPAQVAGGCGSPATAKQTTTLQRTINPRPGRLERWAADDHSRIANCVDPEEEQRGEYQEPHIAMVRHCDHG